MTITTHADAPPADAHRPLAWSNLAAQAAEQLCLAAEGPRVAKLLAPALLPALLPALVPRAALARANGHVLLARSLAFAGGPALAGSLVAWAGAGAGSAFVVAAALSTAAALMLTRLREPPRTPPSARHPGVELRQGGGFVWGHRLLRPILLTAVAWSLAGCVLQAGVISASPVRRLQWLPEAA